jgi:alpha-ribazole phosphatase
MALMKYCILVRHGETDMAGLFCGHSDPALNPAGQRQVETAAELLAGTPPEVIYTSDLQRARQSAQIVAARFSVPVAVRPGLREISFGVWEGLSWDEIEREFAQEAKCWVEQFPRGVIPQGEAFEDFRSRVRMEMEFLLQEAEMHSVVAVTHGGLIRTALIEMYGYSQNGASEQAARYASVVRVPPVDYDWPRRSREGL